MPVDDRYDFPCGGMGINFSSWEYVSVHIRHKRSSVSDSESSFHTAWLRQEFLGINDFDPATVWQSCIDGAHCDRLWGKRLLRQHSNSSGLGRRFGVHEFGTSLISPVFGSTLAVRISSSNSGIAVGSVRCNLLPSPTKAIDPSRVLSGTRSRRVSLTITA